MKPGDVVWIAHQNRYGIVVAFRFGMVLVRFNNGSYPDWFLPDMLDVEEQVWKMV